MTRTSSPMRSAERGDPPSGAAHTRKSPSGQRSRDAEASEIDPWRVCSLVSTGVVLALGLIVLAPLEASTKTAPEPRSQTKAGNVDVAGRAWELRGVVLCGERRMAVLEYRASGRGRIFAIGDVLTAGVVVARIGEDRVILDAEGRPVILRLRPRGGGRGPPRRAGP